MLEKHEHIIYHQGKFYKGTISDYIRICMQDPHEPVNLPRATAEDVDEYIRRRKKAGVIK